MRDAHAHAFSMRDTHAHGFSMRDAHANLFFMRDTHAHVFSWGTLMFRPPSQLHDNTYRPFFHVIVMSWSHLIHAFFHPLGPSSFVMHQTLLHGCHANGQWMAAPGRTSNLKTRMRMASTLTKCPWQHHISTKELVLWNLHPSRWQKLSQHSYSKTCAAHTSTCAHKSGIYTKAEKKLLGLRICSAPRSSWSCIQSLMADQLSRTNDKLQQKILRTWLNLWLHVLFWSCFEQRPSMFSLLSCPSPKRCIPFLEVKTSI